MIIINAIKLVNFFSSTTYNLLLNDFLKVKAYNNADVTSLKDKTRQAKSCNNLQYELFELNYIKINPLLDNNLRLKRLRAIIATSGVTISNIPTSDNIQHCYNPIGDLSNSVRFYITNKLDLVFLSSAVKLKLAN